MIADMTYWTRSAERTNLIRIAPQKNENTQRMSENKCPDVQVEAECEEEIPAAENDTGSEFVQEAMSPPSSDARKRQSPAEGLKARSPKASDPEFKNQARSGSSAESSNVEDTSSSSDAGAAPLARATPVVGPDYRAQVNSCLSSLDRWKRLTWKR